MTPDNQIAPPAITRIHPVSAAVAMAVGAMSAGVSTAQGVDATLEEIIVTASRRETSVQDLSYNIAAFSGETLENQRVTNLSEFARWVPGLTLVDQGPRGGNILSVRGLNVDSLNASEFLDNSSGDTVATYIGEIPLYLDLKMIDMNRVEALLGPQGTLYGAGTLGGAVRYIPNKPDTQESTLEVHGKVYSLEESGGAGFDGDVIFNIPLVEDVLAFRGNIGYLSDPGFIDYDFLVIEPGVSNPQPDFSNPADVAANLRSEKDVNDEETLSARAALLWNITDSLETTLSYYYQNKDVGGRQINSAAAFGTGRYVSGMRFVEPNERENQLISLETVWDLGSVEWVLAIGSSSYEEGGQRDQTDLLLAFEYGYEDFPAFSAFTREDVDEDRFNVETRLVSTSDGMMDWIVGFFYNDFESDAVSREFTPGIPAFFGIDRPDNLEFIQITEQEQTETAVFGELGFQFTDKLHFLVGARWFEYEDDLNTGFDLPLLSGSPTAINPTFQANSVSDDDVIFKGKITYQFNENALGFFTVSEGYRNGSINSIPPCLVPLPAGQNVCALPDEVLIKPDTIRNFEIGAKTSWLDDRLIINGDVYFIDWSDVQVAGVTQNGGLPITVNGGEAISYGGDLSLQAILHDRWVLYTSYAYNKAELNQDAPGLVNGEDGVKNDRLSGSPEHQGSLYLKYTAPMDNNKTWSLDYGITAVSNVFTRVGLRNGGEKLPGFAVQNISLGIDAEAWSVRLYADNVMNKFAVTSVRQTRDFIRPVGGFDLRRYFSNVIRPRTIGIDFRYKIK